MASGIWIRMKKRATIIIGILVLTFVMISLASAADATVCCEKTKSGLYCQNVPAAECQANSRQVATSCSSTSYCKPGTCYDSSEGTCLDKTPQIVCNANNGTWSAGNPAQCEPGCCVLGDQASFVSLVRCKRLAGFLGLQTNFKTDITNEVSCINSVRNQEKGACVYEFEFEKTCKFTTRADCISGETNTNAEFFSGKLCSAEELGTNCGPTKNTLCLPGRDEVYFADSCGNAANIYDSSKINDKDYWANVKDKSQACNPNAPNSDSANCGNCNYLLGSFCRIVEKGQTRATYGDYICKDLNCYKTQNGKSYKHGESWCVYNDKGTAGKANDAVGSRFFKHICINGEEVLEECEDFRNEECIEDSIQTTSGKFSQAACRVNRWKDCIAQAEQIDCLNTDRRDCLWKQGIKIAGRENQDGTCVPKTTPGLRFWEGKEAKAVCAQANAQCIVTFEKGLFGDEDCADGCECLSDTWEKQRTELCLALGDCGPKINWLGQTGFKAGFKKTMVDGGD